MVITRLKFRNRFTMSEKAALYTAANTAQGIGLRIYLDDLASAQNVDLMESNTIDSVNMLVTIGLLTPERAIEILTTPPRADEIYRG